MDGMKKSFLRLVMIIVILVSFVYGSEPPRLIVFISIDQMRADHFVRYAHEYEAGFKQLLTEGIVYTNATLNYSGSSTGPGHATLGTGVYPWKNGIVSNNYTDRSTNKKTYCVEDSSVFPVEGEGGYRSPRNVLVSGLGDWLKEASPQSKVISISYKDRAAILMSGRKANGAYWYNGNTGHMTTSSYYMSKLPVWVSHFNASNWIENNLPEVWKKNKPDSVYYVYGPDDMEGEALWDGKRTFPHVFGPSKKNRQTFDSPFGNQMLLDYARAAIKGEQLGNREVTDLLCISLSSTDNIGSDFGPNSHEMIDNLIRMDAAIGSFLNELLTVFGREHLLVVLSGDHGVMPLPEYTAKIEKHEARRLDSGKAISSILRNVDSVLCSEYKANERLVKSGFINYPELKKVGADIATVEQKIRLALFTVDGVADVYFRAELLDDKTPQRPFLDIYKHSFRLERSPDFLIRFCENCLVTNSVEGTSHGSPYLYDTQVPIIFWGQKLRAQKVDRPVHTVDIAASLAALLSIRPSPGLDGIPLKEVQNP